MSGSRFGLDLSPLRASPAYRRLYVAGFFSALGGQATYVTVAYQLKVLTGSTLAVGVLGLVDVAPLLIFGLYGGVLADRFDRRKLIVAMELVLLLTTATLAFNSARAYPTSWLLYVNDMFIVAAGSLQTPSLTALNQRFVAHDLQRAASALANVRMTTASIIGPALGGLAVVAFGPGWVFVATTLAYVFSLSLLFSLAPVAREERATRSQLHSLLEGLRYAKSRSDVVGTYVVDLIAMTLAYPVLMMPFVAARFHETYALSLLYCGLPLGALLASLTSAWTRRVRRYGRVIVFAATGWGIGIAIFGYSTSLVVVMLGLVVAGGADAVSGIFRQSMWNESITTDVRGRMGGIEMISYALGPTVGQFRAGAMAAWTTIRFSLTVGGLACSGSIVALAAALPSLWRFDASSDPHVAEVRARRAHES